MQIILTKNIDHLGTTGSIVKVKSGYARNYLVPRGLAVVADPKNKVALERQLKKINVQKEAELKEAKAFAAKLEKVSITISKQVGEEEKIFGSVTTAEISDLIKAEGIEVSKKDITLLEEVKKVGVYNAEIKVHPEVSCKVKVWVVAAT